MKPYIVKFNHSDDDMSNPEGMFLCLHAVTKKSAVMKFWQITGGETRNNFVVSVTGDDHIEYYWDSNTWKFFTIPS